ncbi:double-strand break repair protein AddB [Kordiimonas sp. SCSIO 12610]|uniref:double-strand break repair protein AddB n=1 Tax=Kordiimonas sp. SCSIO 12610 TaxID=2829597 RepID=UPI002109A00B|nr:double-strand break repair protein AddB [Kordiimonas sp. SCSIO 12610]UTW55223.1 double-strand break repair protein AddB [Kordiimonas sp. SCSIO 12610]
MLGHPTIYTIPPTVCFVDALAFGVLSHSNRHNNNLNDYTILLPNRRAQKTLREAFLRLAGDKPLLLPLMRPIGDVDEDEIGFLGAGLAAVDHAESLPAISDTRRLMLLAKILVEREFFPAKTSAAQAWRLARDLSRFMDQVQTEGLRYKDLAKLVPEGLAHHWEVTLEFLQIITGEWPKILKTQGLVDPVVRRDALIQNLCNVWRERPPKGHVIAAGSTGSIPVTAELLKLISKMENGTVVLPGFDGTMDDYAWQNIDPTHPQNAMKSLLETMGVNRHEVQDWELPTPISNNQQVRYELISDALRPAKNTDIWPNFPYRDMSDAELFTGVSKLVAPTRREEAEAIAVMLREVLETPEKTAALVTPDRYLARYVRMALKRWNIDIDDSGGDRALISSTGRLMSLIIHTAAADYKPVAFLSLLQHPMVAAGLTRTKFLAFVRRLDMHVMRGARPKPGLAGILERAKNCAHDPKNQFNEDDYKTLKAVSEILAPISAEGLGLNNLSEVIKTHLTVAENLADVLQVEDTIKGDKVLWKGEAGIAIADRLRDLINENSDIEFAEKNALTLEEYAALFDEMLTDVMVRPQWQKHPRISIWGPLEARLQNTDLMILGGLNEDIWPADIKPDPWMSRPMRAEFGLPALERRIGQSAHDFIQAACAPNVILTRAEKIDGAPAVPSRWLFRIEALAGREIPTIDHYIDWANALLRTNGIKPSLPPKPTPPLEARPKALSVTQIETWMRDPYAIYANKILKLRQLEDIDERPNASQKGTLIHKAFENYLKLDTRLKGDAGYEQLLEIGRDVFSEIMNQPTVYAFWWPRFKDAARWFVDHEDRWQQKYETVLLEEKAEYKFAELGFILSATADRIDRNRETGDLAIIDYKTGNIPTEKRMRAGYAPQLPLEGVLARKGAFKNIDAASVERLLFWLIKGGAQPGEIQEKIKPAEVDNIITEAEQGLMALLKAFGNQETPYLSNPRPKQAGYGDYDHLARVKEWQSSCDDENNGGHDGR